MNILLAQCALEFTGLPGGQGKTKYLLVAGGRKPAGNWLKSVANGRLVVCADRGLIHCERSGIRPDMLLGDGDSALASWQSARERGLPMREYPADKDRTDLEIALSYIAQQGDCAQLIVSGVWGGRFDHAYSALFLVGEYARRLSCPVLMADHREVLIFCPARQTLALDCFITPRAVSVLPLSGLVKAGLTGARWDLPNTALRRESSVYVSNLLKEDSGKLLFNVHSGLAGLYLFFGAAADRRTENATN